MNPTAYIHNLSPFAIKITETFGIRWYSLAYLAGFLATYLLAKRALKQGKIDLAPELLGDFIYTVIFGTIIGGRLGYCLFYDQSLLTTFTSQIPFWEALAIHHGGMASHGGMIGILVAAYYFSRKHKTSVGALLDICSIGGTIGIFFGRIANFVNGELVGRIAPDGFVWAVKFPQDILGWNSAHKLLSLQPVVEKIGIQANTWSQAIESFGYDSSASHLVNSTLTKIITQIQAGNIQVSEAIAPLLVARYPSQLFEAALEGALLTAALLFAWRKKRPAGSICALFLILYSIVRITCEQFRMPDAGVGFQIFNTTRGQLLSVGLLLIGAIWLWSLRRPGEKESINR